MFKLFKIWKISQIHFHLILRFLIFWKILIQTYMSKLILLLLLYVQWCMIADLLRWSPILFRAYEKTKKHSLLKLSLWYETHAFKLHSCIQAERDTLCNTRHLIWVYTDDIDLFIGQGGVLLQELSEVRQFATCCREDPLFLKRIKLWTKQTRKVLYNSDSTLKSTFKIQYLTHSPMTTYNF